MPRALVTGGAGFLGSHIADALAERGFAVRVFDRLASPYLGAGQEMVLGDLLEPDALAAAAEGCDCLFHLAALADLDEASGDPVAATRHNVLGRARRGDRTPAPRSPARRARRLSGCRETRRRR